MSGTGSNARYVTSEAYDPRDRFGLYRLCDCPTCEGKGKEIDWDPFTHNSAPRCPDCRGEGKIRQELATCETPEAVGVALVTLAREGEWETEDGQPCALGLLDREPDCPECDGDGKDHTDANIINCPECKGTGKKKTGTWLILPWQASPRNVSDAGKLLRSARKG